MLGQLGNTGAVCALERNYCCNDGAKNHFHSSNSSDTGLKREVNLEPPEGLLYALWSREEAVC